MMSEKECIDNQYLISQFFFQQKQNVEERKDLTRKQKDDLHKIIDKSWNESMNENNFLLQLNPEWKELVE